MESGDRDRTRRLFVACVLPEHLAGELLAGSTAPLPAEEFRVPRAGGLHFTLLFLGDVEADDQAALERALASSLAGAGAPDLRVGAPGSFPRRGAERVLWLGVREAGGGERLAALHGRVLAAAEAAGFDTSVERSRTYRPHVTVARPRSGGSRRARRRDAAARVPPDFYDLEHEVAWRPDAVALVESMPDGTGPNRYRTAWRHALA